MVHTNSPQNHSYGNFEHAALNLRQHLSLATKQPLVKIIYFHQTSHKARRNEQSRLTVSFIYLRRTTPLQVRFRFSPPLSAVRGYRDFRSLRAMGDHLPDAEGDTVTPWCLRQWQSTFIMEGFTVFGIFFVSVCIRIEFFFNSNIIIICNYLSLITEFKISYTFIFQFILNCV